MKPPKDAELTHPQLAMMAQKTTGYAMKPFSFWVNAHGVVYLTVFNVVYNIDRDGRTIARRASDGSTISTVPEHYDPA